ncbi:MAG: CDP-alcohol phosphatidyltransferase family protein [Bacteroidota bacterium]
MPKLPKQHRFVDLSDYGRPFAKVIANVFKNTSVTPIHITIAFIISGILAIICILEGQYMASAFFLILKSILDAADGELARIKNTPSYTGRYFDSISDIILNFLFLFTIWYVTNGSVLMTLVAFFCIQLQGTLYNYYYVIMRNKFNGDATSRIFEVETPKAMKGESQQTVTILFRLYHLLYGGFDKLIYLMDKDATRSNYFPKWFMTLVSTFGLGFQLLVIGLLLVVDLAHLVIPFFIGSSVMILVFIFIRKNFLGVAR